MNIFAKHFTSSFQENLLVYEELDESDRLEIEANLEEAIAQNNNLIYLLKKNKEK
ncbi:MAG: hypothetical protein QNJ54_29340 [Prochloraceae cyanobacterium]|nr:hypothetical protein [Prochloraceae cyanobacterium]